MKKYIGFIMLVMLGLISCQEQEKPKVVIPKKAPKVQKKERYITKDTALVLNYQFREYGDGMYIYGTTNLPENTKISLGAIRGEYVVSGLDVMVKNMKFDGKLNKESLSADKLTISIYANEYNQSKEVLEQIAHLHGKNWDDDVLEYTIDIKKMKEKELIKAIGVDIHYKPIGKLNGKFKPIPNGNIMRYKVILDYKKEPNKKTLEKDIRYYVYQVFKKDPNTKAVSVLCFTRGSSMAFKIGDFAPNGNWNDASNYADLSNFKLNIHY